MAAETQVATPPVRRDLPARLVRVVTRGPARIVLIVVGLVWLIPTFGLLVTSFRPIERAAGEGWWKVFTSPGELTIQNYTNLLDNPGMVSAFWNTFLITAPSAFLLVLIAALAAYAFAWVKFPGRDIIFLVVVGLLVVPLQIGLIPVARLYDILGLFGTLPGIWLFHIGFGLPFAVFLLRNFFIGIPHELLEAARMDGASEWRVFSRVVLPLGIPAVASLLIFQFLWVWNDLLVALVFAGDTKPLTLAIAEQRRTFGGNLDVIASGAFLQMIVPLVVFFSFQRYFVQGLLAGSEK